MAITLFAAYRRNIENYHHFLFFCCFRSVVRELILVEARLLIAKAKR